MMRYCVMADDDVVPDSICRTVEGAASYVPDAKRECPSANVRVVAVKFFECKQPDLAKENE